jgi:hypothetical protein
MASLSLSVQPELVEHPSLRHHPLEPIGGGPDRSLTDLIADLCWREQKCGIKT